MFISDKVSSMTKLQPNTVIRAALDLLNEVGVDGLTTRKLAERLGVQQPALYWHFRNKRALLDALAEAMLAENHTHSVPRADDDWRSFRSGMPAASGRRCSPTAMARASMPARDRAHRRWKRPTRSFASSARRVFGRGRRQCADDNQLLHCWGRA